MDQKSSARRKAVQKIERLIKQNTVGSIGKALDIAQDVRLHPSTRRRIGLTYAAKKREETLESFFRGVGRFA